MAREHDADKQDQAPGSEENQQQQRDEELERYESWRYKPQESASESYRRYQDHPWAYDGPHGGRKAGKSSYEARLSRSSVREDLHAGNRRVAVGEFGEYSGSGRRYERAPNGRLRARKPHTTGTPPSPHERDLAVAQQIEEALSGREDLQAKDLRVRIDDGSVTLSGKVESEDERTLVERTVRHIPGVTSVVSHVEVSSDEPSP